MSKKEDEYTAIAAAVTKRALQEYDGPADIADDLILTTVHDDTKRIYYLYIPDTREQAKLMIAVATFDTETKDVSVVIPELRKRRSDPKNPA